MDVEKVFHMTGGTDHTSYARNSSLQVWSLSLSLSLWVIVINLLNFFFIVYLFYFLGSQKKGSDLVKHITKESVQELYMITTPKSIGIADLGCSSGPNTLSIIRDIIETVQRTCLRMLHPTPEFRIYLNDLPTNDFNSIFKNLPDFSRQIKKDNNGGGGCPSIFIGGYPGSFYSRLFPKNCLHFVYSSYSLHWLSKVTILCEALFHFPSEKNGC